MKNFIRTNLHKNNSGGVSIIIALTMAAVILGVFLLSITANKMQGGFGKNQAAVDAAALATAEYITKYKAVNSEALPAASDYAGFAERVHKINYGVEALPPGTISPVLSFKACIGNACGQDVPACTNISPDILCVNACVDVEKKKVCNFAKATTGTVTRAIEIVFALDVSGSMLEDTNGNTTNNVALRKITYLRDALARTSTGVFADLGTKYGATSGGFVKTANINIGIVPYKGMVDLGPHYAKIVRNDIASMSQDSTRNKNEYLYMDKTNNTRSRYFTSCTGANNAQCADASPASRFIVNTTNMGQLARIPLTERIGGQTGFGSSNAGKLDESPLTDPFKGYWHQSNDYSFLYEDKNPGLTAGANQNFMPYDNSVAANTANDKARFPGVGAANSVQGVYQGNAYTVRTHGAYSYLNYGINNFDNKNDSGAYMCGRCATSWSGLWLYWRMPSKPANCATSYDPGASYSGPAGGSGDVGSPMTGSN